MTAAWLLRALFVNVMTSPGAHSSWTPTSICDLLESDGDAATWSPVAVCELPPESPNLVPVAAEQSPSLEILSVAGPRKQRRLEDLWSPSTNSSWSWSALEIRSPPLLPAVRCDQDMSDCETNSEYLSDNAGSEEPDSNMWNEALYLITGCNTGPWVQHCLEDEELARVALSCRFAVDCMCAELFALKWFWILRRHHVLAPESTQSE